MNSPLSDPQSEQDKFVYRVSHDLQEPTRGIKSLLTLLERSAQDELNEEASKYLEMAQGQVAQLQNMITGLVELSRIGRSTEEIEAVDLKELFTKIKRVYVSTLPNQLWQESWADSNIIQARPQQINNLVRHLLDNWVQHAPETSTTFSFSREANQSVFSITQHEIDLRPKLVESMFDIFYTTQKGKDHVGVGLPLVKAIVENHGGYVEAKSPQPRSLVIYLHFPD